MWGNKKVKQEGQKQTKTMQQQTTKIDLTISKNTNSTNAHLTGSSSAQQIFSLTLGKQPLPYDSTDPTLMWSYNIPTLLPSQKKRLIQIIDINGILQQWRTQTFPTHFSLGVDNFIGYTQLKYDNTLSPPAWINTTTTNVMTAYPKAMTQAFSKEGTANTCVTYQGKGQTTWDLGMMSNIKFRLYDQQGQAIQGPFSNPINLTFKIIHLAM